METKRIRECIHLGLYKGLALVSTAMLTSYLVKEIVHPGLETFGGDLGLLLSVATPIYCCIAATLFEKDFERVAEPPKSEGK
jgi:hypothetical protein